MPSHTAFLTAGALVSGNYDRVAWFYDALSGLVFGPALRRAQQAALLSLPPGAPRVLVLGGGTGWVLTEIFRLRPAAHVLYLEASAQMLTRARQRLSLEIQPGQVTFRHGTEQDLQQEEQFDVLVTFFVLDCFPLAELPAALARLNAARHPNALWLLADFRVPTRWWQHLLLQAMYIFFRLTTGLRVRCLPNLPAALTSLGLRGKPVGTFFAGMVEAVVFQPAPSRKLKDGQAESV